MQHLCPGGLAGRACASQRYVLSNDLYDGWSWDAGVYIQYWLIDMPACPDSAWHRNGNNCVMNSGVSNGSQQSHQQLGSMHLWGGAGVPDQFDAFQTNVDSVAFYSDSDAFATSFPQVLGLAGNWDQAEFNIFGDGCGSNVNVNDDLSVKIEVTDATTCPSAAPFPLFMGTPGVLGGTAETNSMNVVQASVCPFVGNASAKPSLQFRQIGINAAPPPAPFCLLNNVSGMSMSELW